MVASACDRHGCFVHPAAYGVLRGQRTAPTSLAFAAAAGVLGPSEHRRASNSDMGAETSPTHAAAPRSVNRGIGSSMSQAKEAPFEGRAKEKSGDERETHVPHRQRGGDESREALALVLREIAGPQRELRSGDEENDAEDRAREQAEQRDHRGAEEEGEHEQTHTQDDERAAG